ncbi:ABC transporter permease [Roseivirga sp. E12]|uniref:ABC transporter permease n=1 Tax=Roseivirga sp. E12 TaxID=2819237 RepID=UPI001ABC63FD|nr:ABC transporter permease [Roseivirga sp. E12]MBO3699313.1 ABC transporter permease [Roseivirga sp. E12]
MIKSYFNTAFRNLTRNKINSLISILGLSIGIASCLMVYIFISHEISYDSFHEKADRLFRVEKPYYSEDGGISGINTSIDPSVGPALAEFFPEIQYQTRIHLSSADMKYQNTVFRESITLVDGDFLKIFSFPLFSGNKETALENQYSIVLTKTTANKYFGKKDPIGESIQMIQNGKRQSFVVSAIAEDMPVNTDLGFSMLIDIRNIIWMTEDSNFLEERDINSLQAYVSLNSPSEKSDIDKRLESFAYSHYTGEMEKARKNQGWESQSIPFGTRLLPIKDVHFSDTSLRSAYDPSSKSKKALQTLTIIAIVILLISSFNYINLTIGMASKRSKEVGIRKVIGAQKAQLTAQFCSEAILVSLLALGMGIFLTSILIPFFNDFYGVKLSIEGLLTGKHFILIISFACILGLLAGMYPGLVMSNFHTLTVLKGKLKVGKRNLLTKGLMVIQFSVTTILIVLSMVATKQLEHLTSRDLGYSNEGLIIVPRPRSTPTASAVFRNEISKDPSVLGVASSNLRLGTSLNSTIGGDYRTHWTAVDNNFFRMLKIEITKGRDFYTEQKENKKSVIVNQKLIDLYGIESFDEADLGRIFEERDGRKAPEAFYNTRIVGVVNDFHFVKAQAALPASIFFPIEQNEAYYMLIKLKTDKISATVGRLEKAWQKISPEEPINLQFQDQMLERLYENEKKWSLLMRYTSIIIIVITAMGLFGLSLIMISGRIKEIGIRKVLGAKIGQIMLQNIKGVSGLVLIANILAIPMAYWLAMEFLKSYSYHIELGPKIFIIAAVCSISIAICTIFYNVFKTANTNPVNALREE